MPSSFMRRVEAWRGDPHPVATVRLCDELTASDRVRPALAIGFATEATDLHDDDARVLIAAGHLLLSVGELAGAKALLVRAVAIAPADLHLHHVLGEVLLRAGDFVGFERVLHRAAELRRGGARVAPRVAVRAEPEDPFALCLDDEPTLTTSMEQILAAGRPDRIEQAALSVGTPHTPGSVGTPHTPGAEPSALDESGERPRAGAGGAVSAA